MLPAEEVKAHLKRQEEKFRHASMSEKPLWCILEAPGVSPWPCPHIYGMFDSSAQESMQVHEARIPVISTLIVPFDFDDGRFPLPPGMSAKSKGSMWLMRRRSPDVRVFYFASRDPESLERYLSLGRATMRIIRSAERLPDSISQVVTEHAKSADEGAWGIDWTRVLFESVWMKGAPPLLRARRKSWLEHSSWSYDPTREQSVPPEILRLCEVAEYPVEQARHFYYAEIDPELFSASAELLEHVVAVFDQSPQPTANGKKPPALVDNWPTAKKLRNALKPPLLQPLFYRIRVAAKIQIHATSVQMRHYRFSPPDIEAMIRAAKSIGVQRQDEIEKAWHPWRLDAQ